MEQVSIVHSVLIKRCIARNVSHGGRPLDVRIFVIILALILIDGVVGPASIYLLLSGLCTYPRRRSSDTSETRMITHDLCIIVLTLQTADGKMLSVLSVSQSASPFTHHDSRYWENGVPVSMSPPRQCLK